jgi:stage V sporulation protein K
MTEMTSPSDDFWRRLLEPIDALFREALDSHQPLPDTGGRNYTPPPAYDSDLTMPPPARTAPAKHDKPVVNMDEFNRAMEDLDSMIGLHEVKQAIHRLAAYAQIEAERKALKLSSPSPMLHMIFSGNPGTGKTVVARLIGRILHSLGILSSGHTVEVDKATLVGGYLGQTPLLTSKAVDAALGGVLYIDEAYTLTDDTLDQDAYGREAIATLLKRMEDDRASLVVIASGYPAKMQQFLQSNPGLRSRFVRDLDFQDYAPPELIRIFEYFVSARSLQPTKGLLYRTELLLETLWTERLTQNGNARIVRSLVEFVVENQAVRLRSQNHRDNPALLQLIPEDLAGAGDWIRRHHRD